MHVGQGLREADLPGGQAIGQAIVDAWVAAFAAGDHHNDEDDTRSTNPFIRT
jgi:hypothetical protein